MSSFDDMWEKFSYQQHIVLYVEVLKGKDVYYFILTRTY